MRYVLIIKGNVVMELTEIFSRNERWLIPFLSAIIGAVLAFFFSIWLMNRERKKNVKSLESALYNEFLIIKNYFESWLTIINEEFKKPKSVSISSFKNWEFQYLDSVHLELIKQGKVLTNDQRKFIDRIRWKFKAIKEKDLTRHRDTKENCDLFFIPIHHTAYLLRDCVETIYYLNKFCTKKNEFSFKAIGDSTISKKWARVAFKDADLDFKESDWDNVVRLNCIDEKH
jgi:hypothetical protein